MPIIFPPFWVQHTQMQCLLSLVCGQDVSEDQVNTNLNILMHTMYGWSPVHKTIWSGAVCVWVNWLCLPRDGDTADKKGNPGIEFQGKPSTGLWQHKE